MNIANDTIEANLSCQMYVVGFQQSITPYVLECMPDLISTCVRTMTFGWHHFWLGRRRPCYLSPSGELCIVLEVVANCPEYHEGASEKLDIRDPRVEELCGISMHYCRICLGIDCPYNKSNPEFGKPADRRKEPRLHVWGYKRSKRRKRPAGSVGVAVSGG